MTLAASSRHKGGGLPEFSGILVGAPRRRRETGRLAYNWTVKAIGAVLILALLGVGCGRQTQSKEAVKKSVVEYLSGRAGLNMSSMDIKITSVTFHGNQADAEVSFHAKGSTAPGATMKMQYKLERQGNRWVVQGKSGSGGSPHGSAMPASPHGAASPSGAGQLPPSHPPAGGSGGKQ